MRTVEHRRHGRRDPGAVHLSPEGLEKARSLASTIGRFDRVVSSPVPRAVETVEALGFSVDVTVPELALVPGEVDRFLELFRPQSYADFVRMVRRKRVVAEYARQMADLLREELLRVPDEGRLLVVSHGGVIELGAAGARGQDALSFGPAAGYLEGVRLFLVGREWVRGEVVRVPT